MIDYKVSDACRPQTGKEDATRGSLSGPAACNLQRRKDMNTSSGAWFSSEPDEPSDVFS